MDSDWMPYDLVRFRLPDLLDELKEHCDSIYLTGSWARGKAVATSDIDLDVVVTSSTEKNAIYGILQSYSGSPPFIDAKILTDLELRKAQQGLPHFFFWTRYHDGVHIYGKKVSMTLDYERTRRYVELCMDRTTEAVSLVQSQQHLPAAFFLIYECLSGAYFLESYLLEKPTNNPTKEDFLKSKLHRLFASSRRIYYSNTRWKASIFEFPTKIRIHDNLKVSSTEKANLNDVLPTLDSYLSDTHQLALRWLDNHSST